MKRKLKNNVGLSLLEALVSTAIVGIGFIAILQMVNYSVRSISTSADRTKSTFLFNMVAEDVMGSRNTIHGVDLDEGDIIINDDGSVEYAESGELIPTTVSKFAEHEANRATDLVLGECDGTEKQPKENLYADQKNNAPENKIDKWQDVIGQDRVLKCKGENETKRLKVFKLCHSEADCIVNTNIKDRYLYIGRVQMKLNDGKKRRFLYFQADYKLQP